VLLKEPIKLTDWGFYYNTEQGIDTDNNEFRMPAKEKFNEPQGQFMQPQEQLMQPQGQFMQPQG
jgi:hypothetical protein